MTNDNTEQPPAEFLARLAEALKTRDGADSDLSEILATHVLKPAPSGSAVDMAAAAIRALASKRAEGEAQND